MHADDPEIIVVGAGPAGAVAAHRAARLGASVWLVDRATFPRDKVCGCCLNRRAVALLEAEELGPVLDRARHNTLRALELAAGRQRAFVRLRGGLAISRRALDHELIRAAQRVGARFEPATSAHVHADGSVTLRGNATAATVHPRCTIVCDGIAGRSLEGHPGFRITTRPASVVGAGAVLETSLGIPPQRIVMACGRRGYAGAVRLEDGSLDVAAALRPAALRGARGAGAAVLAILREAGLEPPAALADAHFHGTARLTRRRRPLAATRVLVAGDAAGFVEPFTGEGMAWAIAGGAAAARLAVRARNGWSPRLALEWERRHRGAVRRRQWGCRLVAFVLRRPWAVRTVIRAIAAGPSARSDTLAPSWSADGC